MRPPRPKEPSCPPRARATELSVEGEQEDLLARYKNSILPEMIDRIFETMERGFGDDPRILMKLALLFPSVNDRITGAREHIVDSYVRKISTFLWDGWEKETSASTGLVHFALLKKYFPDALSLFEEHINTEELLRRAKSDAAGWTSVEVNFDEWEQTSFAARQFFPELASEFAPSEDVLDQFWDYAYYYIDRCEGPDETSQIGHFLHVAATLRFFSEEKFRERLRSMPEVEERMKHLFDNKDARVEDLIDAVWSYSVITAQAANIDKEGEVRIIPRAGTEAKEELPPRDSL